MGSRVSIVVGLLAGLLAAGGLLLGFVFIGPDPVRATPSPSSAAVGGSPGASASAPSSATGASASPAGSGAGSEAPAGSGGGSQVTENFHIGEAAPALVVPQVGGGTIDLASLKGTPVWVNFMQTTCEPCIDEFPLMNGFAARYAEEGLVVIAVDIREDEGAVAAFASGLGATFPLGLDTDGEAQRAWGAYGLPVHFWIDRAGVVRDGALGGIGADVMADGVRSILPGVVVTPG
jgi:thiol-disulfide isomerase/thioredoxin